MTSLALTRPSHQVATAVVIVPCTARKSMSVPREGSAVSLPLSCQENLETAWNERVDRFTKTVVCGNFYAGRGMGLAREAALGAGARMYVASAGLGLVSAEAMIPPYAVTVGARGDDAVGARVLGRFDPKSWWRAVTRGPCSSTVEEVFASARPGIVMVALSRPYAEMMADDLARLSVEDIASLRLFGWRLDAVLDGRLHDSIMPYDARLDAVMPGTRCDFPQRALSHFMQFIGAAIAPTERHRAQVREALSGFRAPDRPIRPQATDEQIVSWITEGGNASGGIGAALRTLRSQGTACEQKRFTRLYRLALEGGVAV